jgi:outer membrane protein assembly factor BamB
MITRHRLPILSGLALLLSLLVCSTSSQAAAYSAEAIWVGDSDWPVQHIELADLNGDNVPDVIAGEYSNQYYGYEHQVFACDGVTGDTLWRYDLDDGVRSMTIGDLNNDGVMDVIAGASYHSGTTPDGYVHAIDGATGTQLWTFYTGSTIQTVCVGFFNGDAILDVAAGCFNETVYAIDGSNGSQIWSRTFDALWINAVDAADVDGDGFDDVAYAHEYLTGYDNFMGVLDGENGTPLWDSTVGIVVLDAMIEDIDDDGVLEAIFTGIDGSDQGWLQVRQAIDGVLEWESNLGAINHSNGKIGLHTHDLDGDGDLDLVLSNYLGWRRIIAFDGKGDEIMFESDSLSSYPSDLAFGDIIGDGTLAIACAAWDRVMVVSFATGEHLWSFGVDGLIGAVDVYDFDGDKIDDVAAGGSAEAVGSPPNPGKGVWTLRTVQSQLWWEFQFGEYGNGMAMANINNDEYMDVLAVASLDDWVWAIDGETGTEIWHWTGTQNLYAVTSGDFNGDGQIDVAVAGNDDRVTAIDGATGAFMWECNDPGDQIYRKCLASADLNLDNSFDVIAGSDDGNIYAIDGNSGSKADLLWTAVYSGGGCEEVELAEMNGVPPLDVVAITGGQMVVLDGNDGTELWSYGIGTSSARSCEVLDANDDGIPDVAIGVSGASGTLMIIDGSTHDILWTVSPFSAIYEYGLSHGLCNADKAADLIAAADNVVYAFDGQTGTELWSYPAGDDINVVLAADINGDLQDDVLFGADDRIVRFVDGLTGELFFEYSTVGDVMGMAVGDVSGDGALNASCVTFGSDGVAYTFQSLYDASCCIGMTGNIDGDELQEINITDLIFLVTYMFQKGPAPTCMLEADIDGDHATQPNITDLIALVMYMFQNGPLPSDCE